MQFSIKYIRRFDGGLSNQSIIVPTTIYLHDYPNGSSNKRLDTPILVFNDSSIDFNNLFCIIQIRLHDRFDISKCFKNEVPTIK